MAAKRRVSLTQRIQKLVLHTQFLPFLWLYRLIYMLSVKLTVRWLRRIDGVRAIYLRRGLAGPDPVFGLSDIDLLVLVDDAPPERAAGKIRYHYDLLRQVVPMLGEGELGVYTPTEMRLLHLHVPFYRGRFERGRNAWKRLWGEDLFSLLPSDHDDDRDLARWELLPSWFYLSQELVRDDARPDFERRYVAYKMLADTCRAACSALGEEAGSSRLAALRNGASRWPELAEGLDTLCTWRDGAFTSGSIDPDSLVSTFRTLASRSCGAHVRAGDVSVSMHIEEPLAEDLGVRIGDDQLRRIASSVGELPGVERAVIVPRLSFTALAAVGLEPGELSGATIDAYDLLLTGSQMPSVEALRRLNRALRPSWPAVRPYFFDGSIALALSPVRSRPVRFAADCPELTAWIEQPRALMPGLELASEIDVEKPLGQPGDLRLRAVSLLEYLQEDDAIRLPTTEFLVLFWEAMRAACVAVGHREGRVSVPVGSSQVVENLRRLAPEQAVVLEQVHEQYRNLVRGESSEAARYVTWTRAFAAQISELLTAPGSHARDLPEPARLELTVSVLIVTRNRSARLGEALRSLTTQTRPPDQVVVVDNASNDDTAEVAMSFADRLLLEVVREERIGIPFARNAGLEACSGDVVASMDDDCIADPSWLAELEAPLLKDPDLGAGGGEVLPVEGQRGLVAEFYRHHQQAHSCWANEAIE